MAMDKAWRAIDAKLNRILKLLGDTEIDKELAAKVPPEAEGEVTVETVETVDAEEGQPTAPAVPRNRRTN
jgi:hypothetical protein